MGTTNDSVEQLSERFLTERAHQVSDNEIRVQLSNPQIYPDENNPTMLFTCGVPLEDYVLRLELNEFRKPAYEQILNLYPDPFEGLDSLTGSLVTIKLQDAHPTATSPQKRALEKPVEFLGYDGHLCEVLRQNEYGISQTHDIDALTNNIENDIMLYEGVTNSIEQRTSLPIEQVVSTDERTFRLKIHVREDHYLPIDIALPPLSESNSHPVTEFIDNFAAGRIEDLAEEYIYLGPASDCIGLDAEFEWFGVYVDKPPKEQSTNQGWIRKFF